LASRSPSSSSAPKRPILQAPSSRKIATGIDAYADLRERVSGRLSSAERGDSQAQQKPSSRSWTQRIRRCDLRSAPGSCLWRVPLMLLA
jgi:hypothetical protein